MARLTTDQLAFLTRHKIPMGKVFDATGMSKGEYQEAMRREEKLFAFGVTPCGQGGHTLRSRSGNCIQCETANITFMIRSVKAATVYVGASRSKQLIKVGSSTDVDRRFGALNFDAYGGANDWICVAHARCEKAGAAEFIAHHKLRAFLAPATYVSAGRVHETYELFTCGYQSARTALLAAIPEAERAGFTERPDAKLNYNFSDRRSS